MIYFWNYFSGYPWIHQTSTRESFISSRGSSTGNLRKIKYIRICFLCVVIWRILFVIFFSSKPILLNGGNFSLSAPIYLCHLVNWKPLCKEKLPRFRKPNKMKMKVLFENWCWIRGTRVFFQILRKDFRVPQWNWSTMSGTVKPLIHNWW